MQYKMVPLNKIETLIQYELSIATQHIFWGFLSTSARSVLFNIVSRYRKAGYI